MNTAIENPTGQRVFVGIGLAVPSNTVRRYLERMIAGEIVLHPQLGVTGIEIKERSLEAAGVEVDHGVYVYAVPPGSAADEAGIRGAARGDLLPPRRLALVDREQSSPQGVNG